MPRKPITIAKQKKALPRKSTHVRGQPFDRTQALVARKIKDTIQIPETQRELEEAIKYKDFEKVNRLQGYQQERTIISRSLQILGLLRNGFADAYNKSLEYDPTLQLTKDIQEDSETMVKALDEKKDFIINARSNLADLPEATKRKLDSLERDIERYSVDLEKIKALVKKLEKHKKLPREEIEKLKSRSIAREEIKALEDDLSEAFKYGLDDRLTKKLQDAFQKAEKVPVIQSFSKKATEAWSQATFNLRENIIRSYPISERFKTYRADILSKINKNKPPATREANRTALNELSKAHSTALEETRSFLTKIEALKPNTIDDLREQLEAPLHISQLNDEILDITQKMVDVLASTNQLDKTRTWDRIQKDFDALKSGAKDLLKEIKSYETGLDALTHEVSKYKLSSMKFPESFQVEDRDHPTNRNPLREIKTFYGDEDVLSFIPKSNTDKGNRIGKKQRLQANQPNPISNLILAYLLWAEEVERGLDEYILKLGMFQKQITDQIRQGGERHVITNLREQYSELWKDFDSLENQSYQIGDFETAINDYITEALKKRHEKEQKELARKKAAKKAEEKKREQALKDWGVEQTPSPTKRKSKKERGAKPIPFEAQPRRSSLTKLELSPYQSSDEE